MIPGRPSINFEAVSAAASSLIEQGQKPTLANIRTALGGGSFTTISPLLKQWRDSQTVEAASAPIADPAPDEIKSEVDSMASRIWQAAMGLANARLSADREALELTRVSLETERDEAAELADQVSLDLERVTADLESTRKELDSVRVELAEGKKQCEQQARQLAAQDQSIKDSQAALQAAQARANELADLLKTEQSARSRLETEASGLHQRIEAMAGNVASLQAQCKAIENAKTEMQSTLQKQVDDLQSQLKAQRATADDLKSNLSKREEELANAKSRADYVQARLDEAERIINKVGEEKEQARNDAKFAGEVAAELKGRVGELEKQLAEWKTGKKDKS